MYFRIEQANDFEEPRRMYSIPVELCPYIDVNNINNFIAKEVRKQVNCTRDRNLLSYSKTLATALLKYNKYVDNELHISLEYRIDVIRFIDEISNCIKEIPYSIIYDKSIYLKMIHGKTRIINFILDVSNNDAIDKYLYLYTGKHKKMFASCEKDAEVLMMQSTEELVVSNYLDAIYLLYALEIRYRFLLDTDIYFALKHEIAFLDERFFENCPWERGALQIIIDYLHLYGSVEIERSQGIIQYVKNQEHLSCYYDPILQFLGILEDSFAESYALSDYNSNVVSEVIWNIYKSFL